MEKKKMTPEKKAEVIGREVEKLCKKHGCEIGVWLTWRDLLHNFEKAKKDTNINEFHFGLQVRFDNEPTDKS